MLVCHLCIFFEELFIFFAYNAGDTGSIPWLGRPSGEGNGHPLQYSCLENPIDGGVW